MSDHRSPGEATVSRLARRSDMGLQKKDAPDGGEVYTGELAAKALRSVGARAMTFDNSIIVDEGFDFDKAEDAALYAHERVHEEGSGGTTENTGRDTEEIAARAVERMVLHRSKAGEGLGDIMRDAQAGGGAATLARSVEAGHSAPAAGGTSGAAATDVDPAKAALEALLGSGKSHEQIVKDLSKWVLDQLRQGEDLARFRSPPTKFFVR